MADETTQTPPEEEDVPSTDSDDGDESGSCDGGDDSPGSGSPPAHPAEDTDGLRQLMAQHFIEYASYVIKDRAIPDVDDGMKPVQRRILHSLHDMDDGRFHKVANVIGHTMQYHPHGDASIGSALVVLAAKDYFIDRQGNFGNILTGDPASAARYIECRFTPLAREVLFNPETTEFVDSYDGRNREPVTLPAKVPALLMMGAEGIAVGMTTRILPHNFNELLNAQIAILRNRPFRLFPDFQQGGLMDVSEYDDGRGRIVLRAKMEADSDKRLVIREVPATTTTESLMASIEEAARRNKIKIAGINDYTAEQVEIEVLLPRGVHAEEAIKQLYAYTDCQVVVPSTIMVIRDNAPVEMTVSEVLRRNTEKLLHYLRRELEIELAKLQERFHERTLVQLFIEHRIYKRIEEAETSEAVVSEVRRGLEPFRDQLRRDVTDEDIDKLLQIQIRRISRFDISRNREELEKIVEGMKETRHHLRHLVEYAVAYIEGLLARYGKQFPRRTRITDLEEVDARDVALRNVKVGHDRTNHFVGSDVRNSNRNEPPLLCSEFDRLVLLRNDGAYQVVPIPQKLYVGPVKYLLRAEREQVYSVLYRDRRTGSYYAKRFRIDRYIMEKEYASLPRNSIIEALYTNQGVVLDLVLKPHALRKVDSVRVGFDAVEIRSSGARGFKVSGYPVEAVVLVERGTPQTEEPVPLSDDMPASPVGDVPAAVAQAAGQATETPGAVPAAAGPPLEAPGTPPGDAGQAPEEKPAGRRDPGLAHDAREAAVDVGRDWARRTRAATRGLERRTGGEGPRGADAPPAEPGPTAPRTSARHAKAPAAPAAADRPPERPGPAKAGPGTPPAAKAGAGAAAPAPQPRRPSPPAPPDPRRKVIDEETPFFLE